MNNKIKTIISGDIIASTSLNETGRRKIEKGLKYLSKELRKEFDVHTRLRIGDDRIDCFVPQNEKALRIMLAIKCYVKSIPIDLSDISDERGERFKFFKMHGILLAIGIGELDRFDEEKGIIDGEAIYNSGRILKEKSTANKGKVIIKNTLFIKSSYKEIDKEITPILELCDVLLSKCTPKQCKVLYYKLIGKNEEMIVKILKKKQSTINEHSTVAGWNAFESAVLRYENVIETKLI
ncbi:MAG: hypothetical protein KA792_05430 [Bacteroidales bacterium]|nr:hypothetical protein [Bacteroidales bacterium]